MTALIRCAATVAALAALTLTVACSPRAPAPVQAVEIPAAAAQSAAAGPSALPPACQSLLASMQACSDNLTRSSSPLAASVGGRITDMRASIAAAPAADAASFCDTQASAFSQMAQTYHCQP